MKVNKVISAQAARFIIVKTQVYRPDIVATLRQRYHFVRVPQTADELLPPPGRPMVFGHGKFVAGERSFIIDGLEIFGEAIAVKTATSTDDADAILDDLMTLAP